MVQSKDFGEHRGYKETEEEHQEPRQEKRELADYCPAVWRGVSERNADSSVGRGRFADKVAFERPMSLVPPSRLHGEDAQIHG